jgi:hypothetical protein
VGRKLETKKKGWDIPMATHKQILDWQAAHPHITWIGWGIVWAVVLANPVLAAGCRGIEAVACVKCRNDAVEHVGPDGARTRPVSTLNLNNQFLCPHVYDDDSGAALLPLGGSGRGHGIADIVEPVMRHAINADHDRAFDELQGALDASALLRRRCGSILIRSVCVGLHWGSDCLSPEVVGVPQPQRQNLA